MKKEVLDFVVAKTHELIAAPSCNPETKEAAETWLSTIGTSNESNATSQYISDLENDIMPINGLIAFAKSAQGEQVFGKEKAAQVAAHAEEIKANGAKYCDCPACAAVEAILNKKAEILA